ncbi:MAG: LysR substrate-binding domain-containing protein [Bdellovibrionales bacterium]
MITITQLEYLIAVHREGHFGKAAKACFVSQPSLSTQIQKVEENLDAVIFDRSKKPILTTEIGKEIIQQAEIVLREHRKLSHIADIGSSEPKGEFSLAIIPTLAPYLIPLFLKEFSSKYPKVKLTINESKTEDIIKDLGSDKLDCGILVTPLEDDTIIERHLFFEPFYTFSSKDHHLRKKKFISEFDLEDQDLWLLEEGHCFRDQVLKVCSLDRNNKVFPNVEFESGNLETLKNLVKRNSGYTLLPELAVQGLSKEEKDLSVGKFKKPVPTREVSLVHSRSFLKENIISRLEAEILSSLPKSIKSLKTRDLQVVDVV